MIMAADLNNLVRLQRSQIKPAAEMLARAFQDSQPYIYFFPDESRRKAKLPVILQVVIRYGILYGEAYATSPNLEGVAVWLPAGKADMSIPGMVRAGALSLLFRVDSAALSRMQHYNQYVASLHRSYRPFPSWSLEPIGVDPVFQGQGYASTLLRAMLARIDRENLPCYLETQSGKNVSIYQHFGFKVVREFRIPGTEFNNWIMLRDRSG